MDVLAVAGVPDASAQKLIYEQAFAKCKADVVANTPGETSGSAARYSRGLSCMQHFMKLVRLRFGKTLNPIWEITGDDCSTRR